MTRRNRSLVAAVALCSLAGCADDGGAAAIDVRGAWSRATPPGATTGAVYMTLRAAHDDTLVGASVDAEVAASATTHRTMSSGGELSMDASAVALPAGDDVVLDPGADHVMLAQLARPLVAGDSFTLTLSFEHAPDVNINVDIRDDAP